MSDKLTTLIRKYNQSEKRGLIFLVTGPNSSGKTTITRKLMTELPFYQSVSLGVISKLIRVTRPDLDFDDLENFSSKEAEDIFTNSLDIIIDHYTKQGVNMIIEGVQIHPKAFSRNKEVVGGVILSVPDALIIKRGFHPETRFNREIDKPADVHYEETKKFKIVDNSGELSSTMKSIYKHLSYLLQTYG